MNEMYLERWQSFSYSTDPPHLSHLILQGLPETEKDVQITELVRTFGQSGQLNYWS